MEALREITEIERYMLQSPHVKELGSNPFPKDVYAAYAKVVLKSGETLSEEVDKRIVIAMQNDGLTVIQIAKVLSFSPNFRTIPEEEIISMFIRPFGNHEVWAKYEIEKYLADVFQVSNLNELSGSKDLYVRYAKQVLNPGEVLTADKDDKIISLMIREGISTAIIDRAIKNSPNYKEIGFWKLKVKLIKHDPMLIAGILVFGIALWGIIK